MASATSPRRYKPDYEQSQAKSLVEIYHHEVGKYPLDDEDGTWFKKLDDHWGDLGLSVSAMFSEVSGDGKYLLGHYGYPVIFEPPSQANGNQIVIRDVGENGVDDNGLFDDWDSRYGPQMGYWYKKRWPGVYRRACLGVAIGLIGLILIQRKIKGKLAKLSMFCFWLSFLSLFILPWVGSRDRYQDLEIMIGIPLGSILILFGLFCMVLALGAIARTEKHKRFLVLSGTIPCTKCNYDLRGTIAANIDRCPECGEPVPEDTDRDIDLTPPPSP